MLVFITGVPRSGKSTVCDELQDAIAVTSHDSKGWRVGAPIEEQPIDGRVRAALDLIAGYEDAPAAEAR
jgi:adenylate kinase family enzyme